MSKIIIGKVPGYNANINKNTTNMDYTERLKNNLTKITMTPTGYKLNYKNQSFSEDLFGRLTSADLKKLSVLNPSTLYKFGPTQKLDTLAKIGYDNVSSSAITGDGSKVTTFTALTIWEDLVKTSLFATGDTSPVADTIEILATNESTMNEVLSNKFDTNTNEKLLNSLTNNKAIDILKIATKSTRTMSSAAGIELLTNVNGSNQLMSILQGKALGIQSSLPKEWESSDYNNTLQLTIKLISPSGHPTMIDKYIKKPLLYLMLSASPITYDGVTYGFPTLWEIAAEGRMNIKIGAVTAMVITRGGNETQFNHLNQPLNIDVRLTIEPLINGFASLGGYQDYNDVNFKFKDMLVNNPGGVVDSFVNKSNYKIIKL